MLCPPRCGKRSAHEDHRGAFKESRQLADRIEQQARPAASRQKIRIATGSRNETPACASFAATTGNRSGRRGANTSNKPGIAHADSLERLDHHIVFVGIARFHRRRRARRDPYGFAA